ncbi:DUF3141 domain-containing protein [Mangrovicoccus algicola]|uniref:DUF3141 domain-containing protein n=1 Tax=Mangrovicoccus algicola TaxID=2771008 RepID=A0A8J6Z109_9RHOB|nr:DUF3141 domain-containing protein [Mangrovicoccus algicola]MBE3639653.1 DUF3141 domain-containing protein [Mangrovicoccus algicola]
MTVLNTLQDPTEMFHAVEARADMVRVAGAAHASRSAAYLEGRAGELAEAAGGIAETMIRAQGTETGIAGLWQAYFTDALQRQVLFLDALRQRSDLIADHNRNGAPPVLVYDSELVMDGAGLPRPCNYFLLRLLPPEGIVLDPSKRPYVIIDPRAGHGAGIGGFKQDSQVGVAFKAGHPVYFVAFHQMPVKGQTIAHVSEAEAAFLREVQRLHPQSPLPVVVGNCQGGWATAILAATNPDITGPIVLNGAPMSYWSGKLGQDPMRYSGGLAGGVLPAMISGDLSGGIFDGADLVDNFEKLNPARNYFGNYFDLYENIDKGIPRYLGFEKWWGGFYLMTTEEIEWIVSNLFVGNKLAKNMAQLEPGRNIDLKQIRSPIICFASHGDNITPPGQALNWIIDTYASEEEIEVQGQRILYMVHEQVGHLGIFVSSSIANREHSQMAETLANIEALAPGLYEIMIEDVVGEDQEKSFRLSIARRRFQDILAQTGDRSEEVAFAAVARGSEALAEAYDATIRPAMQALGSPELGEWRRNTHPLRVSRLAMGSEKPGMAMLEQAAARIRESRRPAPADNPFRQAERLWADMVETGLTAMRQFGDFAQEMGFLGLYLSPPAIRYGAGRNYERARKDPALLGQSPEVKIILGQMSSGGLAEGLIRMLVIVAGTRGDVRADRLTRSLETMHGRAPLKDLTPQDRVEIIHHQTVIARFAPEAALATLADLLSSAEDRRVAMETVAYVVGAEEEMAPETRAMMERFRRILGLDRGAAGTAAAE